MAQTLPIALFTLLSMLPIVLTQRSTDPSYYYNLCAPSTCNNLNVSYPFSIPRYCRIPDVNTTCVNNEYLLLSNPQFTDSFRVISFTDDSGGLTFKVASDALFSCGAVSKPGYAFGQTLFSLSSSYTYGTHLNCTRRPTTNLTIQPVSCLGCPGQASGNVCFFVPGFPNLPDCEPFYIFVQEGFNVSAETNLRSYLQRGFELRYTKPVECRGCEATGGRCGLSPADSFACFCPSSVHRLNCSDGIIEDLQTWFPANNGSKLSKGLVAAIAASASVACLILLALAVGFFIVHRKREIEQNNENGANEQTKTEEGLKNLVTGISPTRYSYSQVKKFTSNFSSKLGEGGFGSVYKGTIEAKGSSVPIAVKVLKSSKQSEKQFMNEVATIGRIHHNNLVRMLGYCVQGSNRALIYEFMEKGSLDKYIHKTKEEEEKESSIIERLSPQQIQNIALETARGILYLHQGCRSRILHCDIKPHNVLLDSNLSAKVSDFGLARMINKDHSHVSITAAQGTPGYAAPEMWSKSYGQLTEKSDVYSYGMLLLEMVGGRKNYDPKITAQSQVYFPEWAYKQVEKGEFLIMRKGDWIECGGEDKEALEKICMVGLWCIQHIPSNRPSMSRVIQMLEGNVEIEKPPLPFPETTDQAHNDHISSSTFYLSASRGGIELNTDNIDGGR